LKASTSTSRVSASNGAHWSRQWAECLAV
jgi:hypothetical protein